MPRVMVIDDSALMRRMLRNHLESAGFEVDDWLPLSPFEVPERMTSFHPDLILTDYQMPGVNGASVAKMAQKADPNVPVVVLTALRDPDVEAQLKRFGVRRLLSKPIDAATLVTAIRELLPA